MVKKFMDGDVKGSLDIQLKTIDLCEALFCEVNPIPVKKAVELMGLCGGTMRMPLTEMEPAHVEKLKAAMTAYGLLQNKKKIQMIRQRIRLYDINKDGQKGYRNLSVVYKIPQVLRDFCLVCGYSAKAHVCMRDLAAATAE